MRMHNRRFSGIPKSVKNKGCLFLDRDGVIIKDKHYISSENDVELSIGSRRLFNQCNAWGIPIVIVTNQSGISRGYFTWREYDLVTNKMLELIGKQNTVIGIYANSYQQTLVGPNEWRKPGAGMLLEASVEYEINLSTSVMVGDRLSDLMAGANAGVEKVIHVLTGHGKYERKRITDLIGKNKLLKGLRSSPEVVLCRSLVGATEQIVNHFQPH